MSKFNEIIQGSKPVLIDFSAEWCQPCKMMPPILKEVARQLGEQVRILKVDVDKNRSIASQWGISSVPTLIIFKNGQQVFRQSGVMNATNLVSELRKHL
jgi:thioredoxin 1